MEEPELHLNPVLQKKLVRYLSEHTSNQYFISTHSAALMDTPSAEVYHVQLEDGQSIVKRVTSDRQRSDVCHDLGYHPSDLLQANCVIWVEGPSDRIYVNDWINSIAPAFIEGIHYSIMFYGGRLASHLTGVDSVDEAAVADFISLRRLNRRGVIILDSDKSGPNSQINETKERLIKEFDRGPGFSWLTQGREIENYIDEDIVREAVKAVHPSAIQEGRLWMYGNNLKYISVGNKERQASKVAVATYITNEYEADFSKLDLEERVEQLVDFIQESNPGVSAENIPDYA